MLDRGPGIQLVYLVNLILLTGCITDDSNPANDGSATGLPPTDESTGGPQSADPRAVEDLNGTALRLAGCRTWAVAFDWPRDTAPGRGIPGWEPNPFIITSIVYYHFLVCERIGWQAFERGPISILAELVVRDLPPDDCRGDYADQPAWLSGVWFDDVEVAAFAAAVWQMPTGGIAISLTEGLAAGALTQIQATTPSGARTSIDLLMDARLEGPARFANVAFWLRDDGIGRAHWAESGTSSLHPRVATGEFDGGFLQDQFLGSRSIGTWDSGRFPELTASLTTFEDSTCSG
jgi:hypothetical protein